PRRPRRHPPPASRRPTPCPSRLRRVAPKQAPRPALEPAATCPPSIALYECRGRGRLAHRQRHRAERLPAPLRGLTPHQEDPEVREHGAEWPARVRLAQQLAVLLFERGPLVVVPERREHRTQAGPAHPLKDRVV